MSKATGSTGVNKSQGNDEESKTPPDVISEACEPSVTSDSALTKSSPETSAAKALFNRASQTRLTAQSSTDKSNNAEFTEKFLEPNAPQKAPPAISREGKEAAAQYFATQNGKAIKEDPAKGPDAPSPFGESGSMKDRAETSINDFTPPDDDGIAAITGSHKAIRQPGKKSSDIPGKEGDVEKSESHMQIEAHDIEAAIRGEAAPFAQTQVDQDALPAGGNDALNQALDQALNRALNALPSKNPAARRPGAETQAQLVNPFDAQKLDAHKHGFLDSIRNVSKATRSNLQASTKQNASFSQMPAQNPARPAPAPQGDWRSAPGQDAPGIKPNNGFKNIATPKQPDSATVVPEVRPSNRPSDLQSMPGQGQKQNDAVQPDSGRNVPFRGRTSNNNEGAPSWPQESEFDRVRAVWTDQVGAIKAAQPARRSTSVARNLRSIMTTGICNVREVYSLRGLACLMVFISLSQVFTAHVQPTLPLSTIAAQIFFVMSGFFVTRQLMTNETPNLAYNLTNHYARRAISILPLYFGALAVLLAWGHLPFPESFFSGLFNYKLFELNHNVGVISQYWTMCIEIQFYAVFPFILLLTPKKLRLTLLILLTGLSVLAGFTSAHTRPNSPDYLLLPITAQFLLVGAFVGFVDSSTNLALRLNGTKCFLLGLVMQIGLQAYEIHNHVKMGFWPDILWKDHAFFSAISCILIVFGLWRTSSPVLKAVFGSDVLVYLGKISYAFYLLMPVCFILQPSISALDPQIAKVSPIIVSFVLGLILSIVAYQYVQRPILNMRPDTPQGKNKYALR